MVDSTESYDRAIEAAGTAAAKGDAASIEQAETLYRKALTAGERARGPFDLSLVPALTGLGAVLLQQGSTDDAVPILTRAVAIAEQQLGGDNPDVVILLNDVSRLYLRHGAHAHAEPLLQRLLEVKRVKGEDHPEVATVLASIASVRQTVGRHDEAEQLWRRVLDIRTRTLAPNHIATASALEHLGLSCAARGKIPEALQLLQRALGMREITLGAEHPSLRAVRERIADLQLQASDDLLEDHDIMPAMTTRPRLSVAPHLASPLAIAAPASPPAPPPSPAPQPALSRQPTARLIEPDPIPAPVVVPAPVALAVSEPAQAPAPAQSGVPYLNVLMDIKDELEETEPATAPAGGWAAILGAIKVGLRERRAAAIAAVIGVLALPAIGYGVASAMRANRGPEWAQSNSSAYALVPQAADSALASVAAPEALRAPVPAEAHKDTAASTGSSAAGTTRNRPAEARPAPRPAVVEEPESPVLVQRPIVGRLDSVARSISVPSQNVGASFDVQLQSSLAKAQRRTVAELTPVIPARRARLIGSPPVPRYPPQLAQSSVSGEVRVRFDVDTLGRPVVASFSVVASPHPAFSDAVKRVLPDMRFEPARTPGPALQAVTESVEMSFQFVPLKRD
jgi:TonB family protein